MPQRTQSGKLYTVTASPLSSILKNTTQVASVSFSPPLVECLARKRALISALHRGLPQVGSSSDPFQVPGHNTICEEDFLTPKTVRLKFSPTLSVRFVIPGKDKNFIDRQQPIID